MRSKFIISPVEQRSTISTLDIETPEFFNIFILEFEQNPFDYIKLTDNVSKSCWISGKQKQYRPWSSVLLHLIWVNSSSLGLSALILEVNIVTDFAKEAI